MYFDAPAFGGLSRDPHRRHEVTEDRSRCLEVHFASLRFHVFTFLRFTFSCSLRYVFVFLVPSLRLFFALASFSLELKKLRCILSRSSEHSFNLRGPRALVFRFLAFGLFVFCFFGFEIFVFEQAL